MFKMRLYAGSFQMSRDGSATCSISCRSCIRQAMPCISDISLSKGHFSECLVALGTQGWCLVFKVACRGVVTYPAALAAFLHRAFAGFGTCFLS